MLIIGNETDRAREKSPIPSIQRDVGPSNQQVGYISGEYRDKSTDLLFFIVSGDNFDENEQQSPQHISTGNVVAVHGGVDYRFKKHFIHLMIDISPMPNELGALFVLVNLFKLRQGSDFSVCVNLYISPSLVRTFGI